MTSKYILQRLRPVVQKYTTFTPIFNMIIRQSSYQSSKLVGDVNEYTNFEMTKSPEEWEYVQRLLPQKLVPEPVPKAEYPSNWKPAELPKDKRYFVPRTRNYMLPVYLKITHRGMRHVTTIRKIQGDIFELSRELKKYLEEKEQKDIAVQVNEFVGHINIKCDHVNSVKDYLLEKGF